MGFQKGLLVLLELISGYGYVLVKWIPPNIDVYKLNNNDVSRGNLREAVGRGIIRNHHGDLIAGFASYYSCCTTNMKEEARALLQGIQLCQIMQITNIMLEIDSSMLLKIPRKQCHSPWHLDIKFQQIFHHYSQFHHTTNYGYGEVDQLADLLTNRSCNQKMDEVLDPELEHQTYQGFGHEEHEAQGDDVPQNVAYATQEDIAQVVGGQEGQDIGHGNDDNDD
ncbi:hypothetical protein ACH5RR_026135 [Cinchona calisaya]|uniref:RNase H type-1 domain-containing protein n=1 Tax=Cinchona calisaya TaxID=153742 RepID=A0ABD2Z1N0_9GENT